MGHVHTGSQFREFHSGISISRCVKNVSSKVTRTTLSKKNENSNDSLTKSKKIFSLVNGRLSQEILLFIALFHLLFIACFALVNNVQNNWNNTTEKIRKSQTTRQNLRKYFHFKIHEIERSVTRVTPSRKIKRPPLTFNETRKDTLSRIVELIQNSTSLRSREHREEIRSARMSTDMLRKHPSRWKYVEEYTSR